jgi:pimeloyl-ACP methyl ester carboxylesterase
MDSGATKNSKDLTLILLHGFCENKSMWDHVYPSLNADRVICLDLSGFGEKPLENSNVSLKDWSNEVKHYIVEHLSQEDVVLLGHSMGGYIGLELILQEPNLLTGFGLVHSHCFEDPLEKRQNREKVIRFIQKNGTSHWLPQMAESLLAEKNINNKALFDQAMSFIQDVHVESAIAGQKAMLNKRDRSSIWSTIEIPLLLVAGEYDTHCTMENSLKMASMGQQLQMVHLPESGHLGMVEQPKEFVKGVNDYLSWVRSTL